MRLLNTDVLTECACNMARAMITVPSYGSIAYGSLVYCFAFFTWEAEASRAVSYACQPGPLGGAYGWSATHSFLRVAAPIPPLTAWIQLGSRVTESPTI